MGELWAVLGALAAVVLPMVLAWWLLGMPPRRRTARADLRGNIPDPEDR